MTAPVGPTGLAQRCTGSHAEDEPLPGKRIGLGAAGIRSTLLSAGDRIAMEQLAVTASFELHLSPRHTLQFAAGGIVAGSLIVKDVRYELSPGGTAAIGWSMLVLKPNGAVPFVSVAASLSGSGISTHAGAYVALDIRAAVTAGWVLYDRFTPYAAVRAFGGPVFWRGQTGTDAYHYQVAAGFVVGIGPGLDLACEIVPLGEQSLSIGFGYSF